MHNKPHTEDSKRKMSIALKGHRPWNKGIKTGPNPKHSKIMKGRFIGEKNGNWKGESALDIHHWVRKWKGLPRQCGMCGTTTAKKYEWANIDHKYKRILEDFIRMCTPCHRKYDRNRGVKINRYI